MRANGSNGHRPPALGDVTITRTGDDRWDIYDGDELVAAGLPYEQIGAVIRGDLPIDELEATHKSKVSEPKRKVQNGISTG